MDGLAVGTGLHTAKTAFRGASFVMKRDAFVKATLREAFNLPASGQRGIPAATQFGRGWVANGGWSLSTGAMAGDTALGADFLLELLPFYGSYRGAEKTIDACSYLF